MIEFSSLIGLILGALVLQNVLLTFFFGVESLESIKKEPKEVLRFTVALLLVLPFVSALSFFIKDTLLVAFDELGVIVYDLTYLNTLILVMLMVLSVALVRLLLSVLFPKVLTYTDTYLKHFSMHTMILGSLLVMIASVSTIVESVVFAVTASIGYGLVLLFVSAIEKQLKDAPIPKGFKGLPLQLVILALIALIFSAFGV
jgi:electron transport complex protein RnfA